MDKYLLLIKRFQDNNKAGIYFVENQLKKHLESNEENQTEIEHILDYLYSTNKIFKIGYITIKEKADKWSKKLQKLSSKDKEKEEKDYEVVKKWRGFKMVKLISKSAYNREGRLMNHCVSSYYGKNDDIYSLRDKNNKPHCTISKSSQQIKGKGNGSIHPKYIKYVVEFLEYLKIDVRDSEMKNLGYVNIEKIDDKNIVFPKEYLFKKKYFFKNNLDKIVDKNGDRVQTMSMWSLFGMFDFTMKTKIKFNFDFKKCATYFKENLEKIKSSNSNEVAMHDSNEVAMDDSNEVAMDDSNEVAMHDYNKVAMDNYNKVAMDHSNEVAMRNSNKVAMDDYNKVAMHDSNEVAMDHSNEVAMRNSNEVAMDDYNKVAMHDSNEVKAGEQCIISGRSNNKVEIGKNSIATLNDNSKIKGKIGSWFVLVERNNDYNIIDVMTVKIDGKKIKEDIWYTLKNGKFIEVK